MTDTLNAILWGREFFLPVVYESYEGEKASREQLSALEDFSKHDDWIAKARMEIESLCREQVMGDDDNTKKDNIFSYIKPEAILVKREKKNPRIALICKYRYEPEHGLAVVFTHEGKITVGIQDIIL